MPHGRKTDRDLPTYGLRRTVGGDEFRVGSLEVPQLSFQSVIFGIGNLWGVISVIGRAVRFNLLHQLLVASAGIGSRASHVSIESRSSDVGGPLPVARSQSSRHTCDMTFTSSSTPQPALSPGAIEAAADAIAPHVRRTPQIEIPGDTLGLDYKLVFKLEYLQVTGAFKARGAVHYVATQEIAPTGIVAASGGNHGAAVAYAAQRFGHEAHIFVPTTANPSKVERLVDLDANVHLVGTTYPEALEASREYLTDHEATSIAAFDDPVVMAGAGTVAREFDLDTRGHGGLDAMLVAVGGGGLAGGAAVWCEDRIPVIGCETVGTASYAAALEAGQPVPVPISGVAADHLGATVGAAPWAAMRAADVQSVVVTDQDVLAAQARLWRLLRVVVEPGVAAPFAALLTGRFKPQPGSTVGVVLCGANVTLPYGNTHTPNAPANLDVAQEV